MFNAIISENFTNPGFIADEEFKSEKSILIENPICGDRILILVDIQDNLIQKAQFQAWGCATSIATANLFCKTIDGMNLQEVSLLSRSQIKELMGELDPSQFHCFEMLLELFDQLNRLAQ